MTKYNLLIFLSHLRGITSGRLLLFDWQPEMFNFLENQFPRKWKACRKLIPFLQEKQALAFMDKSCKLTADQLTNEPFEDSYVPVFSSDQPRAFCRLKEPNSERISIVWLTEKERQKSYRVRKGKSFKKFVMHQKLR